MKHVRAYGQARQAMGRLFSDDPTDPENMQRREVIFTRYKEIWREDLRVTTAVLEHFTHGLRNVHTFWIWHVEDADNAQRTTWLQECAYCIWTYPYVCPILTQTLKHYNFSSPNALA